MSKVVLQQYGKPAQFGLTAYKGDKKPAAQSGHSRLGPHRAVLSLFSVDEHHNDQHPCKYANGSGVPES